MKGLSIAKTTTSPMRKPILVRLEEVEVELLDRLVKALGFSSRSDLIRYIIRSLAERILGIPQLAGTWAISRKSS